MGHGKKVLAVKIWFLLAHILTSEFVPGAAGGDVEAGSVKPFRHRSERLDVLRVLYREHM